LVSEELGQQILLQLVVVAQQPSVEHQPKDAIRCRSTAEHLVAGSEINHPMLDAGALGPVRRNGEMARRARGFAEGLSGLRARRSMLVLE